LSLGNFFSRQPFRNSSLYVLPLLGVMRSSLAGKVRMLGHKVSLFHLKSLG
jgi:hypothetical protein